MSLYIKERKVKTQYRPAALKFNVGSSQKHAYNLIMTLIVFCNRQY